MQVSVVWLGLAVLRVLALQLHPFIDVLALHLAKLQLPFALIPLVLFALLVLQYFMRKSRVIVPYLQAGMS